jgi:glycosyltransferase involved in cell wall biosynthesis
VVLQAAEKAGAGKEGDGCSMSLFAAESPFAASRASEARVIVATIERPVGDTGIHAHTQSLLEGFKRAGIEAELANPFTAGPKWLPLFAVRKLILKPVNKTWSLRWYRHWHYAALRESLTRSLLRRPAEAVIAQCPVSARAALEVRRRLKMDFRIAMVCHFNYSEATEYRDKGELKDPKAFERMMKLEGLVLQSVDQVIFVSNWAQRVVEQERGIRPKSSCVIWNGTASSVAPSQLNRNDIGVAEDDLMLINVGSLEPRKNQIALLDLFSVIRAENAKAKLVLVGGGPQRGEIEQKIQALNLSQSVIVLGHRTDVPALLSLADVYVHYSKLENCPVILLEAARAGLPIAAIPAGGVGEIGEKLGSLVPLDQSDLSSSVNALRPLLTDGSLRKQAGAEVHVGFEAHFTRDAMIGQYIDALDLRKALAEVVR